jgi:hypothetical protein
VATSKERLEARLEELADQGMVPLHLHEVGEPCDERCVPQPVTKWEDPR